MALVALNVRRKRQLIGRQGTNYSTTTEFAVDDSAIKLAVPSICKKDGVSDGLVNSKVSVTLGNQIVDLWVTETVTEILALS